MPVISTENGPFRLVDNNDNVHINYLSVSSLTHSHLYVVVINSDVIISSTKRMITSVEDITTRDLLQETNEEFPKYYVASVVNADQYLPDHRMGYYLGAEDFTTDAEGHTFDNKELNAGSAYFFRVFSIDSTLAVCQVFAFT